MKVELCIVEGVIRGLHVLCVSSLGIFCVYKCVYISKACVCVSSFMFDMRLMEVFSIRKRGGEQVSCMLDS